MASNPAHSPMTINFLGQVFYVKQIWELQRRLGICRNYDLKVAVAPAMHERVSRLMHKLVGRPEFKWYLDVDVMDDSRDEFVSAEKLELLIVALEAS